MIKVVSICQLAKEAFQQDKSKEVRFNTFLWLQVNSFTLSNEEFYIFWNLLVQVFDNTFGESLKFKEKGESSLEMFDSRSSYEDVDIYLLALEKRINTLKLYL